MFFLVAITVIIVYTFGLPMTYAVLLRRRRHLLEEARAVVRRRYQSWRKLLKQRQVCSGPHHMLSASAQRPAGYPWLGLSDGGTRLP